MTEMQENMITTVRKKILEELEYLGEVSDEKIEEMICSELNILRSKVYISFADRVQLGKLIYNSLRRLDILQELIDDPDITEIMINGPSSIFIEREGSLIKIEQHFESVEKLKSIIQQIVSKCNRVVNESSPIVDARLDNGSRVNVVLNPIALNGPILTIRRFPKIPLSIDRLIEIGSFNEEVAELLKKLVKSGYNIIVSGGTGSGKTTFLNALSSYIPKDERIITIEDSAELQIQGIENLVRLETKNANVENCKAITIRDLIKTSLRMRPTRIIVGEVRGGEAMDMICSAMNCGHDGSMSTVHANSAIDTISRLETMILMAVELPIYAIRRQICSGVDIIIHLGRLRDKTRKVLEICEIKGYENNEIELNTIYQFREKNQLGLKNVKGGLVKIGELIHEEKLIAAGFNREKRS